MKQYTKEWASDLLGEMSYILLTTPGEKHKLSTRVRIDTRFINELTHKPINANPMKIHLGTSSWNFDEWRGVFYPDKMTAKDFLPYYAGKFNSVEVNTSFYALPRPSTVEGWMQNVPPGFTFSLKMPRAISHDKKLVHCAEETLGFLEIQRLLGDMAGPGFLQLPPHFTRERFGKVLADYLDWLGVELQKAENAQIRLAVEVRADDLQTPAFAKFVAERGLALVLGDRIIPDESRPPGPAGKLAPDLFDDWMALIEAGAAPTFTLIRWIGDNRDSVWAGPEDRNRKFVFARDERLDLWAHRLAALHQAGIEIFGYMHNPYEGHAPISLDRLRQRLEPLMALPAWPPEGWVDAPPEQLLLFE